MLELKHYLVLNRLLRPRGVALTIEPGETSLPGRCITALGYRPLWEYCRESSQSTRQLIGDFMEAIAADLSHEDAEQLESAMADEVLASTG